jgi:excisionase family DNA binding protein
MLLSAYEVAETLGMSPEWVWKQVREGTLPCIRLSRRAIRFDPAEIEAWVQEHHFPVGSKEHYGHSTVP